MLIQRVSLATIDSVLDIFLLLLLGILRDEPFMIPFSVQKVRESSASNVDKLMENGWDDCIGLDLKVEAGLLSQSEQLLQHESG